MTNLVSFPGLGLEFQLNRVACRLLGKDIYWYGIIITCGLLLAVAYSYWKAPKYQMEREKIMDLLFFAIPLCIIGARAYYVIFNPSVSFNEDGSFSLYRAIAIWDGGLAIYGGILMAIVTVLVYCRVRKQNFWDYVDLGSLCVMIGQFVGRWGNFVNVEAYGGQTTLPWRMTSTSIANELWRDGYITTSEEYQQVLDGVVGVHPTFLYESVWNLLGFLILALLARKKRWVKGQTFAGYLIWYGLGRAIIEGLRTDSLYLFGSGIRVSQAVGMISVIAGVVLLVIRLKASSGVQEAAGGQGESESPLNGVEFPEEQPAAQADTQITEEGERMDNGSDLD